MTKRDEDAARALNALNLAYRVISDAPAAECQLGWEDQEAFREAMSGPVKTADEAGAEQIAKQLGEAISPGKPN